MKKDLDKSEGCWYRFLKFYTNHLIMAKSQLIFSIKGQFSLLFEISMLAKIKQYLKKNNQLGY